MITFNDQGVRGVPGQEDEELEDFRSLQSALRAPEVQIAQPDIIEGLRKAVLQKLHEETIAEYDSAKNWEDHLLVRAQREVLAALIDLMDRIKRGEA